LMSNGTLWFYSMVPCTVLLMYILCIARYMVCGIRMILSYGFFLDFVLYCMLCFHDYGVGEVY